MARFPFPLLHISATHHKIPKPKKKNCIRGTRACLAPYAVSVTISDTWDIVSLALYSQPPRSHKDRGKRTALPVRTTFPLLPVLWGKTRQKLIHACFPHPPSFLNALPSTQRTPRCARKKTPRRSSCFHPQSTGEDMLMRNRLTPLQRLSSFYWDRTPW